MGTEVNVPDGSGAVTTIGQVNYENWWQASVGGEARHAGSEHPDHLDKRDLLLMALATSLQTPTKPHYLERMILVDRALFLHALSRLYQFRALLCLPCVFRRCLFPN